MYANTPEFAMAKDHLTRIKPFFLQARVTTANSKETGLKPSLIGVASRTLDCLYSRSRADKSILSNTVYSTAKEPSACRCFAFNRSTASWMAFSSRPITDPTADSLPTRYCHADRHAWDELSVGNDFAMDRINARFNMD